MLVLSRKKGEGIVLTVGDHTIVVDMVEHRGCYSRIGITAPQEVRIVRRELIEGKEKKSA